MKKISLQFIAEKAGVSKSLVSKVLNNREVRVSPATRQRIMDVAKEYIYIPNRIAAGLRTSKTNIIGCITPELNTDFFMSLVDSIEKTSRKCGYELILCNTRENIELERRYLELYKSGMMEGMIVMPSDNEENLKLYQMAVEEEFPLVFLDRYIEGLDASFVTSDGYTGTRILTEELIKRGHKDILYMAYERSVNTSVQIDRYKGYTHVMEEHGLIPQRTLFEEGRPARKQDIYRRLAQKNHPSALLLMASITINNVLQICDELDYYIPDDIDLATFDHFSLEYSDTYNMRRTKRIKQPPLVMEQNTEELGRRAVEMLCRIIDYGPSATEHIFIKPQLYQPPEAYR